MPRLRAPLRPALPAALALLAACSDPAGPRTTAARLDRAETVFSVPDSVRAGQPFLVRVTTVAGRCDQAAPARVTIGSQPGTTGPVAVVRPEVTTDDSECAPAVRELTWAATVTFADPGFGTIEFRGAEGSWSFGLRVVR